MSYDMFPQSSYQSVALWAPFSSLNISGAVAQHGRVGTGASACNAAMSPSPWTYAVQLLQSFFGRRRVGLSYVARNLRE